MKEESFSTPLILKILIFICILIIIAFSIILKDLLIMSISLVSFSIVSSVSLYFQFVKYTVSLNKISIIYPLFYKKEYNVNNIIGFTVCSSNSGELLFYLFFEDNNYFRIRIIGRKMKDIFIQFTDQIKENVKNKCLNLLFENGLKYKINKKIELLFEKDNLQIINDNGMGGKYFYKKDIKNIEYNRKNGMIRIKVTTNDDRKIIFDEYMLKGGIFLIEYIIEECKK
jgi:hypothetical protein